MELLLPLIFVVVAFYLILLRPVLNQQRRRRRDLSKLAVGDEVLTTGGFYATVRAIRTREDGPLEILLEVVPGRGAARHGRGDPGRHHLRRRRRAGRGR